MIFFSCIPSLCANFLDYDLLSLSLFLMFPVQNKARTTSLTATRTRSRSAWRHLQSETRWNQYPLVIVLPQPNPASLNSALSLSSLSWVFKSLICCASARTHWMFHLYSIAAFRRSCRSTQERGREREKEKQYLAHFFYGIWYWAEKIHFSASLVEGSVSNGMWETLNCTAYIELQHALSLHCILNRNILDLIRKLI